MSQFERKVSTNSDCDNNTEAISIVSDINDEFSEIIKGKPPPRPNRLQLPDNPFAGKTPKTQSCCTHSVCSGNPHLFTKSARDGQSPFGRFFYADPSLFAVVSWIFQE